MYMDRNPFWDSLHHNSLGGIRSAVFLENSISACSEWPKESRSHKARPQRETILSHLHEPLSKLLVSPLITPLVAYIIPCITPL